MKCILKGIFMSFFVAVLTAVTPIASAQADGGLFGFDRDINNFLCDAIRKNDEFGVNRSLRNGANPNTNCVGSSPDPFADKFSVAYMSALAFAVQTHNELSKPRDRHWEDAVAQVTGERKPPPNSAIVSALLRCGADPNYKIKGKFATTYTAWDIALGNKVIGKILDDYDKEKRAGTWYTSCDGEKPAPDVSQDIGEIAAAKPPKGANDAEKVFENVWRSIVVIKHEDGQGSGVIIRPNIVATNCHVVDTEKKVAVFKHDNRQATTDTVFAAVMRAKDEDKDFCLLDVAGLWGIPASIRKYDSLAIGEDVYAVGSPKGLDLSLSSGLISQLRQSSVQRWIQTDAAISPGSSGGGLFDSDGNLVGITTEKLADEDVEGIGFAIPADLVLEY